MDGNVKLFSVQYDWSPSQTDTPINSDPVHITFLDGYRSDNAHFDIYEVSGTFIAYSAPDPEIPDSIGYVVGEVEELNGEWTELDPNSDLGGDPNGQGGGGTDTGGPVYYDQESGSFVVSNIGAMNEEFIPSVQLTKSDLKDIEYYDREMLDNLEDSKARFTLEFENTTSDTPGLFALGAEFIEEMGKKSASGGRGSLILEEDGSTPAKLALIETDAGWKKQSLAGTEWKAMVEKAGGNASQVNLYTTDVNGTEVAVVVQKSIDVELNVEMGANTLASTFFSYMGMDYVEGESNIGSAGGEGEGGNQFNAAEGESLDASSETDDVFIMGDDGANVAQGGAGRDTIIGLAGDDTLAGGSGADFIEGGAGDDTIRGGANGAETAGGGTVSLPIWDYGDRAAFAGDKDDYSITQNADGSFTVTDLNASDGDDGTDTLSGIEILQFDDDEVLLGVDKGAFSFTDHYTGQTISEDWANGTDFDDIITPASGGRSFVDGRGGNDIIVGDPGTTGGSDNLKGGEGNDFIDGAGRGESAIPWENENVAEFDAPKRNFTWTSETGNELGLTSGITKITYAGSGITELDGLAAKLELDLSNYLVEDQEYWVVSDKRGDEGLGTDILTNIDVLYFNDNDVRLSVFKDPWGGFIEGTDFGDSIEGEGVSEWINAGAGDDRVFGGAGSDDIELGRGNDFVDGGADEVDFDSSDYLENVGFSGDDLGNFDPSMFGDQFAMPDPNSVQAASNFLLPDDVRIPVDFDRGSPVAVWSYSGLFVGVEFSADFDVFELEIDGVTNSYVEVYGMNANFGIDMPDRTLMKVENLGEGSYAFFSDIDPANFSGADAHGAVSQIADMVEEMSVRGDTVHYQGDFDRYILKTFDGDEALDPSSELYTIVSEKFSDISDSYWVEDNKVVVVADTVTGSKSEGTDIIINAERIQFDDNDFLLSVQTEINSWTEWDWQTNQEVPAGEVFWRGTFGDDVINFSTLDTVSNVPSVDRMEGNAGDDILISGAGGDRLIGGVGNDILDGGANGTSGEVWRDSDVAEYNASIDRFTLEKVVFEGKNLTINGADGSALFKVAAITKGEAKIGKITKVGSEDVLYQIDEGETFFVVTDSLPASYGGQGTDLLIGMEKAQFGFDWEGEVNFQVQYDMWGHEVNARGTIFNDVIDLRAGRDSDAGSGFAGFADFNDGVDIWDAEFFVEPTAGMGFDIWNWSPGSDDTPVDTGIKSLEGFNSGDPAVDWFVDSAPDGLDIYKINDGTSDRWVAYDSEAGWVVEEVEEGSSSGVWKVHYFGVAEGTIFEENMDDIWGWEPVPGEDVPAETGVSVAYDDGFTDTNMTFDIYTLSGGETVAYFYDEVGGYGWVQDVVVRNDADDGWVFKPFMAFDEADHADHGIWDFQPGAETAIATVTSLSYPATWGGGTVEGSFSIYQIDTDTFVAYDDDYGNVFDKVAGSGSSWEIVDSAATMASAYTPTNSGMTGKVHDSWIEGGLGNDIILAGQGQDNITGGAGDDFIDGGSESDFLAQFVSATAKASDLSLTDPDTGRSKKYDIFQDEEGTYWAWDGKETDPSYFKVVPQDGTYVQPQETVDDSFYNDRWASYDRAHFSGDQIRYDISEVYLKLAAGRPDLTAQGDYQELSFSAYSALSASEKTSYGRVVKVVDLLPAVAGGDGTDYLINVEEAQFADGHEQLEVDSWFWSNSNPIWVQDWSWTNGWDASSETVAANGSNVTSYLDAWGNRQDYYGTGTSYKVYEYDGSQSSVSSNSEIKALVDEWSDAWGSGAYIRDFVTWDGSQWVQASETTYDGTYRGTIKDDVIKSLVREQRDEIFGKGGDDLIVAGASFDKIKGGKGDDTIWGGANGSDSSYEFTGDLAFYTGTANRYEVIQNVYVKADTPTASSGTGVVERSADGKVILYADEVLSVNSKGVIGADAAVSGISSNSDYHKAIVVIDSLADNAGGEGVDILIGLEGLVFGHTSTGDHGWLPSAWQQGSNYVVNYNGTDLAVTTLSVSSMSETFFNGYWDNSANGGAGEWVEEQNYKVNYTGTIFEDEISYDHETSFVSMVGQEFVSSDVTEYTYTGGKGDDTFIGTGSDDVKDVAIYSGAKTAYDITVNGDGSVTISHKLSDALGGTGTDTLINIDGAIFNYMSTTAEERVRFSPEAKAITDEFATGNNKFLGTEILGTEFNDTIDAAATSGKFVGLLNKDDVYLPGGGTNTFYAGNGSEDTLKLNGMPIRYNIEYNGDGTISFTDYLADAYGGQGTTTVKDVEAVEFEDGVFRLEIGDYADASTYELYFNATGTPQLISTGEKFSDGTSGKIQVTKSSVDLEMFAMSPTPAEHAPTISFENMVGSEVGTTDAPFDLQAILDDLMSGEKTVLQIEETDLGWGTGQTYEDVLFIEEKYINSYDSSGNITDKTTYTFEVNGYAVDDVVWGSENNDRFEGILGDDIFWGRGEQQVDWWDSYNTGDVVVYSGDSSRYTISEVQTDTDANDDGKTDSLKIDVTAGSSVEYFTVTDKVSDSQGGYGVDSLVDIERIQFDDKDVWLSIRDMSNAWDNWTPLFGTSNDDDFRSYTDDTANPSKEYNINGGAGDDLIIGGVEPSDDQWAWGDNAIYEAEERHFDISVESLTFETGETATSDWDGDGTLDGDDLTLSAALKAKFGGTTINRVTVEDVRPEEAGGLGTDTLYGIEHIEYRSGQTFSQVDLEPRVDYWYDWDAGADLIGHFQGTAYGDVFLGDAGNTNVEAKGGDDVILAGDGGDSINPGTGNDYVNSGTKEVVDANNPWKTRDEVRFDVNYSRVEVERVELYLSDTTGRALENSSDQWLLVGYQGEAAIGSDVWATYGSEDTTGYTLTSGYLVTDTLPESETGSIGTNLLVGVDAISFADEYLDVAPRSDTWSWTDWFTNETITESFKQGTPFSDSGSDALEGGSGQDTLEGRAGDDALFGLGGGDRLNGGKGNDVLDGGDNGSSGDIWRDNDRVQYNGIEERFTIYQVKVDADAIRADKGASSITVYDPGAKIPGGVIDGFTVDTTSNVPDNAVTAYIVSDALTSALGGLGNDLLIDVEVIEFDRSQVDLGLRIQLDNWDGDSTYDWVQVTGTKGADLIKDWNTGSDIDSDANTNDAEEADSEIRGKQGDDVIFGYGGGDRISGGAGNDFIDGGADGQADQWGYERKDEAIFDGAARNYSVTTYAGDDSDLQAIMADKFSASAADIGYASWTSSDSITVVVDDLPSSMGGTGTDVLRNIEFINFQDKFVALSMETFFDRNSENEIIRAFVDGTDGADTIGVAPDAVLGESDYDYSGNDDLIGNDGDDVFYGGAGGDWITPGKGTDVIDGGANGVDIWSGQAMVDVVYFESNYESYEIEDSDDEGTLVITVTDLDPDGEGTAIIKNVEVLNFNGHQINVGVTSHEMTDFNGDVMGTNFEGSIFGDTITGTSGSDYISGNKGADTLEGGSGPDRLEGGLGNDILRGGVNGLDAWGNPGEDVAVFNGDKGDFEIIFYDVEGEQATSYQDDGYIKVKDSRTDEGIGLGTDTLYGIEAIEFNDDFISYFVNNSFVDLDGDGNPDVGGQRGTSSSDTLTGTDMDEKIEGKEGEDYLLGGGGADFINGGVGADIMIGGDNDANEMDIVKFDYNISDFSVFGANGKFGAKDASTGIFETDSTGKAKLYNSEAEVAAAGYTAVGAYSFTVEEDGEQVTDYVLEVEGIETNDGFARFAAEYETDDFDFDGVADFAYIGGGFVAEDMTEAAIGSLITLDSNTTAAEIMAADNFFDGGLGSDLIYAGAGDDVINPGQGSGNSSSAYTDWVDGGEGDDVLVLSGNKGDWSSAASSDKDKNSLDGYTKYTNSSDGSLIVYAKGIEAIEYSDGFETLSLTQTDIDRDGDGITDERQYKGTTGDEAIASVGNEIDFLDAGLGDDVLSAGNGADVLIGGAGSDFMFGGANTGTDAQGNALKDVAVFGGTSTGESPDFTIAEAGFVICTGFISATGECTIVTTESGSVGEISDKEITASDKPTIYKSVEEVYVAEVASDYDRVVNGEQDGTADVIQGLESDGSTSSGYYANIDGVAGIDIFSGSDAETFDSDNMTLTKVLKVTDSTDNEFLIFDAHEVLDVYTVTNSSTSEVDTLIGVEEFEFSDGKVDLSTQSETSVTFSLENGVTELDYMSGTQFSDEFVSSADTEIFTGGTGSDVFVLGDGSGTDRITDFDKDTDSIEILKNINDTSITEASSALSRVTDTSDGALINLGYTGTGSDQILHSILLEGISKDDLTASNFTVSEIL